jgi:hypothetical protein
VDPLYSVPDREGGTPALGEGLPGLTREQLSVIHNDHWDRERKKMSIEQWEKAVRER